VPKRSWHLLLNPTDYWHIITTAESLCADTFLQVTFRCFLKEFKARNISLKNKRSHFGLVIRPNVYCLLNGVVLHCAFLGGRTSQIRPNPNFGASLLSILHLCYGKHLSVIQYSCCKSVIRKIPTTSPQQLTNASMQSNKAVASGLEVSAPRILMAEGLCYEIYNYKLQ
jgi:hypothetical protein